MSRRFCFTLNNYSPADLEEIKQWSCRYLVVGQEVGESGTPHLQGYVEFTNKKTLKGLKGLNGRAHWEVAHGDSKQASEYCKKDGNFFEKGDRSLTKEEQGQIAKDMWESAFSAAKEGKFDEITHEMRVKHYNTWKAIHKDHMGRPDDLDDVCGIWIHGKAGNGKSYAAREFAKTIDDGSYYEKMANKWWDGYQDEPVVIIDDLDVNHACLGHHLKIWADRYSFLAESKGYAMRIRPKWIVVTSQYHPDLIFTDEETCAAIRRRFKIEEKSPYHEVPAPVFLPFSSRNDGEVRVLPVPGSYWPRVSPRFNMP